MHKLFKGLSSCLFALKSILKFGDLKHGLLLSHSLKPVSCLCLYPVRARKPSSVTVYSLLLSYQSAQAIGKDYLIVFAVSL